MLSTLRENYKVLSKVGLGQFFAQMVRSGPRILIPLYAADILNLDVSAIGLILSISAAVDMTLFYPTGIIMDKFGRKFAIIPSFFIQGFGLALIPLVSGSIGLTMVAAFIGLGNGLGSGTMMTLGADLAPNTNRGEFLGVWRLIGDTGFTIGPSLAGSIAEAMSLPSAAIFMSLSGLCATLVFGFLVPETTRKTKLETMTKK